MSHRIHTNNLLLEMTSERKYPVIWPNSPIRHPTESTVQKFVSSAEHGRCLCECVTPIFKFCQLIGILPAQFVHSQRALVPASSPLILSEIAFVAVNIGVEESNDGSSHQHHPHSNSVMAKASNPPKDELRSCNCTLSVKLLSIPSLVNIAVMTHFITVTVWVLMNMKTVLKLYFSGTDLYTFGLQVELLYLQACGILINAFFSRRKLQRVWTLIQMVYNDRIAISHSETRIHENFGLLKRVNYILVAITSFSGLLYATYFMHFVFRWCFFDVGTAVAEMRSGGGRGSDLDLLKVKPPCPFSNGFLLLQKLSYAILTFYNLGFSALFSGFCAIIWLLHKDIGSSLRNILKGTTNKWCRIIPTNLRTPKAEQLEHLRISHETLCRISRLVGDCFGMSILIVCVCSLLSITCAIYTGALGMGIFNVNREEFTTVSGFYVLSIVHGFIAVLVLILVLISGQIVQNAACKPVEIICKASHLHLTVEERHQVSIFLHKVGASSTEIRACSVTKIGLSFLAAAATNVTTYILVILQFRLGVEPQVEG